MSDARRPWSILAIAALAWLQVAACVILGSIALYASSVEVGAAGFVGGFLRSLGYSPARFGAREAVEIAGGLALPLLLAVAELVALRRRMAPLLWGAAAVSLAASFLQGGLFVVAALVLVLSLLPVSRAWLRDEPAA
jgi:hypothetical protein